jgi:hypothetical protein
MFAQKEIGRIMFKLSNGVNTAGTSLQSYLDGVKAADLKRAFGECSPNGFVEEEKGYDGQEWQFVSPDGQVFNVYSRWGEYRIGAFGPCEDFKAWLLDQLAASKV